MAGDPSNSTNGQPEKHSAPRVKTFSCPKCGGAVTLRYPGASLSAVCESCNSIIDTSNDNYKILSTYILHVDQYKPVIPLGTRGKLENRLWEVIGFMVRKDGIFFWTEYLLFNPYYGYRFLVCVNDHWNFVEMIKRKPSQPRRSSSIANLDNKTFKLFNRGTAEVVHVLGEFYWKVIAGSTVVAEDYINPPLMLSVEKSDNDVVWSIGKYVPAETIQTAFKLEKIVHPYAQSVGPNQPRNETPAWKKVKVQWLVLMAVATIIQMYFCLAAANKFVFQQVFPYTPNSKASDISSTKFTLDKSMANAKIVLASSVDNSWVWVGGDLVSNGDGSTYPFDLTNEYYHGYDVDGYWSEGSLNTDKVIHSVPAGDYYLNFDCESGDFKSTNEQQFRVSVFRDVPTWSNYFWCLSMLAILPIISWLRMHSVEVARWSASDYSPYQSNS